MRRLAVAAALALACAGCKKTLHWKSVEDGLATQLGRAVPVASVTCPETEVHAGLVFVCHMTFKDGGDTDVHIQLLDDLGSWRLTDQVMLTSDAAAAVARGIKQKIHVDAKVDCGKGLRASSDGRFLCKASSDDGSTATVAVKLDGDGYRWQIVK